MGIPRAGLVDTSAPADCAITAVQHVRRSTALLAGRPLAYASIFLSDLLLLRLFPRADYGAFSYALAIVGLAQAVTTFEMSNALGRWVPIFRQRGHLGAVRGSVVVAFGFVAGVGSLAAIVVSTLAFTGVPLIDDPLALRLLVVLALLIPVQGLDVLVTGLFAILGQTRAILLQTTFVKPVLRIALVGTCLLFGTTIQLFAYGYLAIAVAGLLIYFWSLGRTLLKQELWPHYRSVPASYPIRELLGFAAPLALTVIVWSIMESSDAILLGYFRGVDAVAAFRGVLPLAQLNKAVTISFAAMFLPAAAGLYARGDSPGLSDLYWKTAIWMAALTFPIFVCTFCFSRPLLALVSGERYVDSAPVLTLLSFGYFVNTALGFNGLTLKTFNKLRVTVSIDVAVAGTERGSQPGGDTPLGCHRRRDWYLRHHGRPQPLEAVWSLETHDRLALRASLPARLRGALRRAATADRPARHVSGSRLGGGAARRHHHHRPVVDRPTRLRRQPDVPGTDRVPMVARPPGEDCDGMTSSAAWTGARQAMQRMAPYRVGRRLLMYRALAEGRRRARTLLPELASLAGAGSPYDWAIHWCAWTGKRTLTITTKRPPIGARVVLGVGPADKPAAIVLMLPETLREIRCLERQQHDLSAVQRAVSGSQVARLIPLPVAHGIHGGCPFFAEQALRGRAGNVQTENWVSVALLQRAADALSALHRHTATSMVVGDKILRQWVDRPLARIRRVAEETSGPGAHAAGLDLVCREVRARLWNRTVRAGWVHGDFWLGNVLMDPQSGAVTGLIDWDRAGAAELGTLDLFHFLVVRRMYTDGHEFGEVVASLLSGGQWRPDERAVLDNTDLPFPATDERDRRMLLWLLWMRRIASDLRTRSSVAMPSRDWIRRNIDVVLLAGSEVGSEAVRQ